MLRRVSFVAEQPWKPEKSLNENEDKGEGRGGSKQLKEVQDQVLRCCPVV